MKAISWLFLVLLGAAILVLSIGNKDAVTFSFYPLPFEMDIPLFALILTGAFLGLILGSIKTWISSGKARQENRQNKRENLRLQGEVARLTRELEQKEAPTNADAPDTLSLTDQRKSSAA